MIEEQRYVTLNVSIYRSIEKIPNLCVLGLLNMNFWWLQS